MDYKYSIDSISTHSRSNSLSSTRSYSHASSDHSENQKDHDILTKIIIIGDAAVGKSCLTEVWVDQAFDMNTVGTIGIDVRIKNVNIDGKVVKVQVWDTAGQERYRNITKGYYRGADGMILAFDVTDRSSFDRLGFWLKDVLKVGREFPKIIVGNKVDLESRREVSTAEAQEKCSDWGIQYIETSAKKNINVDHTFLQISALAAQNKAKKITQKIMVKEPRRRKNKCCVVM
jgi:small GTP-binding protein